MQTFVFTYIKTLKAEKDSDKQAELHPLTG
jgi:hypothetical protein